MINDGPLDDQEQIRKNPTKSQQQTSSNASKLTCKIYDQHGLFNKYPLPSSTTPIESSNGLEKIKHLYLEDLQGDIYRSKKAVWHNLCLEKDGVEV